MVRGQAPPPKYFFLEPPLLFPCFGEPENGLFHWKRLSPYRASLRYVVVDADISDMIHFHVHLTAVGRVVICSMRSSRLPDQVGNYAQRTAFYLRDWTGSLAYTSIQLSVRILDIVKTDPRWIHDALSRLDEAMDALPGSSIVNKCGWHNVLRRHH